MRAKVIVMICLALAAASSASLASDIPFDLAGLSSNGFPSYLLQSSFSGLPAFMPANIGSMEGFTSYFPGTSTFGFPAMSGLSGFSGPSFSSTQMGFPDISGMIGQNLASQINTGLSPSADGAYTEASNGKTIKIKLGDTIRVQLNSRVDLGYIWNLSVTDGLNITGTRIYPPQQLATNLATSTIELLATQEWDINAIKTGTQVINATCSRSTPAPGDKTFILTVIVE